MSDAQDQRLLEALLDSWDRNNTIRYSPLSRPKFSENKVDRCGSVFQAVSL
jgi:hypothetical protein